MSVLLVVATLIALAIPIQRLVALRGTTPRSRALRAEAAEQRGMIGYCLDEARKYARMGIENKAASYRESAISYAKKADEYERLACEAEKPQ